MNLAQPPQQRNVPVHSWRPAALCVLVATSLLVAACGGSDNGDTSSHAAAAPKSTPSAKSSPGTLNLSPEGDQLMFDTNQLTAKAGNVTIDFTNDSDESHSVVLIDSANNVLGQTPVFEGGTKSFSVALKSGTYTYYCSVPGHRQAGMQGTLTVE